jgi:hypothetical protein
MLLRVGFFSGKEPGFYQLTPDIPRTLREGSYGGLRKTYPRVAPRLETRSGGLYPFSPV